MISLLKTDAYKLHHQEQYPFLTQTIYSNLTPRNMKIFNEIYGDNKYMIVYGLNYVISKLKIEWKNNFFDKTWDEISKEIGQFQKYFGNDNFNDISLIKELYNYQKLPIEFIALQDYSKVYPNTPIIKFWNTDNRFYWLVGYIETYLLSESWSIMTTANISRQFYLLAKKYSNLTCDDNEHIFYQFHDFSYRGISSTESAIKSGIGHLAYFIGSDNLPAIMENGEFKKYGLLNGNNGKSVIATEHSVMSTHGKENELKTYDRLIGLYPNGILSIVSDTWNIWNVCDVILPSLKDKILNRNGKLVIRPDSGDPVEIIIKVIELLDKHFGHEINKKGYKILNPKVGLIYGDSINYDRAIKIFNSLEEKKYASSNVVLGIGAFTYQYITRDLLSFAVKSTAVEIDNEWKFIQKDPITDKNKKSLIGFIKWNIDKNGIIGAIDKMGQLKD